MTDASLPGASVPLPVPPDMPRALGYPYDARYVVFFYQADTDDLMWNDGIRAGNAQPWVFKEYLRHRAVEPLLRAFDLTSPDSDRVLVIDQGGSRASVATGAEAAEFLRQHRPPLPELPPDVEQSLADYLTPIFKEWQEQAVDPQAVQQAMAEQRGRVGRMVSFLDMCPVPPPKEGRGS